jgi:putative Mg2+ transporter-C (MgtC) family protein
MEISPWLVDDAIKLLIAMALGGAIGLERELVDKPAGLRTNILIAVGSTLITIMSVRLAAAGQLADPGRVAAQIVTGVGFLGAGSIIQTRAAVVGLTTAATIWSVAGIGIAVGAGYSSLAAVATLAILLCLTLLRPVEGWAASRQERTHYHLTLDTEQAVAAVSQELRRRALGVETTGVERSRNGFEMEFTCIVPRSEASEILSSLLAIAGVRSVVAES